MARMIHSMLRVLDERKSVAFYTDTLGLAPVGRFEFDSFTLVYLANDEQSFELELTINHGRTEPYALGEGYGHLAVSVADVVAEHARMQSAGHPVTPVKTMQHESTVVGQFFFLTDPDGYRIEVLQRGAPGRFI
ncbi:MULTISPECIES: VOC family protein [Acetobacter]|jgi:lactoylglutathione lyase|uniref:Aldoketomutase n=1 Tax=Acetobacter lovaniensis TaxID=104100 RepID=A0A841QEW6_9PROT|nr:VOC family protein [Acetobacter lovaniensis]MBB6457101.1 lactoylglutathione lyase [Acetobacter lovaniensis]MCI1697684.1 VOC family protein [Acetobacter lovaniensis]MCI1795788.1 VOC family protein [Acetobacter lovaniensis]MCP1239555.1 VOC family protein [Acetobacter lovaniensis]NHN81314.1 lactoylglutathione lyase [Acetobacter lovaniensis]